MTDEFCARPGCGAPKAWHTRKSTIDELDGPRDLRFEADPHWGNSAEHSEVYIYRKEGVCVGRYCSCPGYLAPEPPEPPKPERKPYVVEATETEIHYWPGGDVYTISGIPAIPLDEYLAAHPQPLAFPANTKCAVRGCDYYTATVLCTHCAASLAKFTKQQLMDGPTSAHAALCVCGGTVDDHDPVTGRCHHVVRHMWKPDAGLGDRFIEEQHCFCQKFEAAR